MNKSEIKSIVQKCAEEYMSSQDGIYTIDDSFQLFGKDSIIDSMGLVNIIIDIESRFLDEDIEISLTSEKAMSRRNSPFRTISTLAGFIKEQIEGNDE